MCLFLFDSLAFVISKLEDDNFYDEAPVEAVMRSRGGLEVYKSSLRAI